MTNVFVTEPVLVSAPVTPLVVHPVTVTPASIQLLGPFVTEGDADVVVLGSGAAVVRGGAKWAVGGSVGVGTTDTLGG